MSTALAIQNGATGVSIMEGVSIPLSQGKVAIVDAADAELVNQFKWSAVVKRRKSTPDVFYAVRTIRTVVDGTTRTTSQLMHCLLLETDGDVDHIDGDGLNNRRSNLRPATRSQNMANQRVRSGSSTFRGVTWNKKLGRWQAQIMVNYRNRYLGLFDTQEDAARAFDAAARDAFGAFANTNFPQEQEAA